jgi:hypothetical protein
MGLSTTNEIKPANMKGKLNNGTAAKIEDGWIYSKPAKRALQGNWGCTRQK